MKESGDFSDVKPGSLLRDVLDGNILTNKFVQKQYGLLVMIAVLLFVYVGNRYSCETQMKRENRLKQELKDLKYESLTISAELMQLSRRSNVLKQLDEKGLGLVESTEPPVLIDD